MSDPAGEQHRAARRRPGVRTRTFELCLDNLAIVQQMRQIARQDGQRLAVRERCGIHRAPPTSEPGTNADLQVTIRRP